MSFPGPPTADPRTRRMLEAPMVPLLLRMAAPNVLVPLAQGAGRLLWPVLGNIARLVVAAAGGWLALRAGWGLVEVFGARAAALVVYGAVNAGSIAAGAWFGQPVWRRPTPVRQPGVLHEA